MIVTDRSHQIAVLFVQIYPHGRSRCSDIETGLAEQSLADHDLRLADMLGQWGDPEGIDLHHPQIRGAVSVRCCEPWAPAFYNRD
jgi:hypothetical protein